MKIILTEDQKELLHHHGTIATTGDKRYMYLPYWFVSTDDDDVFDMLSFERLPEELKNEIKSIREK